MNSFLNVAEFNFIFLGNLLPGNEASQTKDPPDTSRTDLTEDETPRLQFENNCCRLLLLSDKTPKSYRVAECCLADVVLIHYKNDSSVLNDLLRDAVYKCEGKKVQSVAFMCHSQDAMIHLCSSVEKVISMKNVQLIFTSNCPIYLITFRFSYTHSHHFSADSCVATVFALLRAIVFALCPISNHRQLRCFSKLA